MHKQYMACLNGMEASLSFLPRFQWLGAGIGLKHKTQCLVEFDREIVLAQKAFDMSESVRNSPITGVSTDMSAKKVPTAIQLNHHVYFLDLDARNSMTPEVVIKQTAGEPGTISYKVEFDTSDVKAVCKTISEAISETLLGSDLLKEIRELRKPPQTDVNATLDKLSHAVTASGIGEAFISPAPFELQNCTINIPGVRIGDLDKPEASEPVMSIDAMANQHFEKFGFKLDSTDEAWKEAYRTAHLRAELRKEPEYIQSADFGKPGKAGWRLYKATGRLELTDEQGTARAVVNPCK